MAFSFLHFGILISALGPMPKLLSLFKQLCDKMVPQDYFTQINKEKQKLWHFLCKQYEKTSMPVQLQRLEKGSKKN